MTFSRVFFLTLVVFTGLATRVNAAAATAPAPDFRATFLKLCDLACAQLSDNTPDGKRGRQFYKDSYSVRALAVAYDLTGDAKYLNACQAWSDKMIKFQAGMEPKGAYYMNYGRKPGENTGYWYAADCSSVGMGVLATAVRTKDSVAHERYVRSARDFADLMINQYTRDGGVTDGIWPKFDGPWWCSTGIFGSLAFLLYDESGDHKYLDAGLAALDWLNRFEIDRVTPYPLSEQGPALIMYYHEAYSAGLARLQPGTERYAGATVHIQAALKWMETHHGGNSGGLRNDYNAQWGSKAGGMPFHLYVWSKWTPDNAGLAAKADDELAYICSMIFDEKRLAIDSNPLSQLMNFTMMSLAEKLSPGSMYRHTQR